MSALSAGAPPPRGHPAPREASWSRHHLAPQSLGNLFRGDMAVRSFWCCLRQARKRQPQLFDLQRPSLSPGWIKAVTGKPTPHPSSPPEQPQTEHPSPGIPGPKAASHQPHTTSESWDLKSRLVSASPSSRSCSTQAKRLHLFSLLLPAQKGLCTSLLN